MGFNLVNLALSIQTEDVSRLRNYLSLSGNEYAAACRCLSCHCPARDCEDCSNNETCGWYLVFGQVLTSDPAALKRHQKPPLPFIFSFPPCAGAPDVLDIIEIGLVVIGRAIPHLEMLLNGFSGLFSGASIPVAAEIRQIACRDYQGSYQNIDIEPRCVQSGCLVPGNLVITSTEGLLDSRNWLGSTLCIQLLTPLRLLDGGHNAVSFEFGHFARSVMRRVSSLAYYYGESEMNCDYKELSRQVADVNCTDEHFSYAKVKNRKLSGIIGHGSFEGDFSQLMPLLLIGSYVHTGKGASFGMGMYDVLS